MAEAAGTVERQGEAPAEPNVAINVRQREPAWKTPLFSWLAIVRPGRAAAGLADAPALAFVATYAAYWLLFSVLIVFFVLWEDTVRISWTPPATATTAPATTGFVQTPWESRLQERSLAEVWSDWHPGHEIGAAEVLFLVISILYVAANGITAWVYLPSVYGGGSVASGLRRSFKAVASMQCPLLVAAIGYSVTYIQVAHSQTRRLAGGATWGFQWQGLLMVCVAASLCVLAWWLERGMRALQPPIAAGLPPICEGCGYDLTHAPADGRCPECGTSTESSLAPDVRRPGAAWESRRGWDRAPSWLRDGFSAVFRPVQFYGRVKMRTGCNATRPFAAAHLVLLGPATLACITFWGWRDFEYYFTVERYPWEFAGLALLSAAAIVVVLSALLGWRRSRVLTIGVATAAAGCVVASISGIVPTAGQQSFVWLIIPVGMSLLLPPLFAWILHRMLGAVVCTWWFVRGYLPVPQYARKIIEYEIAFMWAPWLYVVLLMSSFMAWGDWMSEFFGGQSFRRTLPLEPQSIAFGLAGMCLLWMNRYRVAGKAVRWANF